MSITDEQVKTLTYALNHDFKFQIQYVDYEDGRWTVPIALTHDRYSQFMQDRSVVRVKLIKDLELTNK